MITEPLQILPSGRYIVIIDTNGNEAWLDVPTKPGTLMFDGNQFYWATGGADSQLHYDLEETDEDFDGIMGLIGTRVWSIVNDTGVPMIPSCVNGKWSLIAANIAGLPTTGFGVAAKPTLTDPPQYMTGPNGIIVFNAAGEPRVMAPGVAGSVLTIVGGEPLYVLPNAGQAASGISATGLDGVVANCQADLATVNVKAPSFMVTDGSTEQKLINVDINVDTGASGAGGVDVGTGGSDKWYYIHIIWSATDPVAGLISESQIAPTLPGTYTHSGVASVFRVDSGTNIVKFAQRGRDFYTVPQLLTAAGVSGTTLTPMTGFGTHFATLVPPNVKSCSGNVGGNGVGASNQLETADRSMMICSDTDYLAKRMIGSRENNNSFLNFKFDSGQFYNQPIINPASPTLYWQSASASNRRRVEITGYSI